MKIRGIPVVVACFISWIHVIGSSKFSLYQSTTDHTCDVSDVILFPGPVRNLLECAASCRKGSSLCYNNGTSTCMCCLATRLSGSYITKCFRRQACLNGWTMAGGLCLFAHSQLVNFTECKNVCNESGGKILTPKNPEQISDVLTFIEGTPDADGRHWLGVIANTMEPDRPWYYSDTGNVATYFNWAEGEPNVLSKLCVIGKRNGQWIDHSCYEERSCVCQI